jgi:hypothetical protein
VPSQRWAACTDTRCKGRGACRAAASGFGLLQFIELAPWGGYARSCDFRGPHQPAASLKVSQFDGTPTARGALAPVYSPGFEFGRSLDLGGRIECATKSLGIVRRPSRGAASNARTEPNLAKRCCCGRRGSALLNSLSPMPYAGVVLKRTINGRRRIVSGPGFLTIREAPLKRAATSTRSVQYEVVGIPPCAARCVRCTRLARRSSAVLLAEKSEPHNFAVATCAARRPGSGGQIGANACLLQSTAHTQC